MQVDHNSKLTMTQYILSIGDEILHHYSHTESQKADARVFNTAEGRVQTTLAYSTYLLRDHRRGDWNTKKFSSKLNQFLLDAGYRLRTFPFARGQGRRKRLRETPKTTPPSRVVAHKNTILTEVNGIPVQIEVMYVPSENHMEIGKAIAEVPLDCIIT